jgi:hypothetical protein
MPEPNTDERITCMLQHSSKHALVTSFPCAAGHLSSRGRRLTLQSRGQTPASQCLPLISNVGHHGRFVAHRLRSAAKAMPSPFSASSAESTKYFARFSRHRRSAARNGAHSLLRFASWSHVASSFHPSAGGVGGGCCSASNQQVVGASRRSAAPGGQSVGAAAYGGSFLSLCHRPPYWSHRCSA